MAKIEGLENVLKNLRGLEPKVKLKFAKNAIKAGAAAFKKKAIANSPRKMGALKSGYGVRAMRTHPDYIGSMLVIKTNKARTKSQIKKGNDPYYWFMLEYGTKYIDPMLFLKKTFESLEYKTLSTVENKIASDVSKYNGN